VGTALPRRSRPFRVAGPDQAAWRHHGAATLVAVAAAGALAGIGTAWIVVHGGPDRPAVPNLPPSPDDHRRVLAVVAYLNAQ